MNRQRFYLLPLILNSLTPGCTIKPNSHDFPQSQTPSKSSLEYALNYNARRLNQLVDDIEVLSLMYEENRYKEAEDLETSAKYTQLIGNRIPKILTPDDKLYFESLELTDSLQNLSPIEQQSNWSNIRDLNRTLKQFKLDNYKPPISREEWKRANERYSKSLDGLIS